MYFATHTHTHTHTKNAMDLYILSWKALQDIMRKGASCRIIHTGWSHLCKKSQKKNRIWISASVCLPSAFKISVWGEVWDWGEGQEGFSLCTFQSSTLYSNTLFKFLKLRCVYVLLVQLKTKLIKKIRPVSFLRPNII